MKYVARIRILLTSRKAFVWLHRYVKGRSKSCLNCEGSFMPKFVGLHTSAGYSTSLFCHESCEKEYIAKAMSRYFQPRGTQTVGTVTMTMKAQVRVAREEVFERRKEEKLRATA